MRTEIRRSALVGVVGVAFAVAALAGCVRTPSSTPVESWTRDGRSVSTDVISSYDGAAHCEWQRVRFLHLSAPLHQAAEGEPRSAQYVRDPEGVLKDEFLRSAFRTGATLPVDARPTGYQRQGTALWLADSDRESTAYLVTEDPRTVEAWPRARPNIGCD
jgi:hypothetical protein